MPPRKVRMLPGRRTPEQPGGVRFSFGSLHVLPAARRARGGAARYCFCVSAGGAAMGAAAAGLAIVFFFLTSGFFFIASRRAAGS